MLGFMIIGCIAALAFLGWCFLIETKPKPKEYFIKGPSFPMTRKQFNKIKSDRVKGCHFPDDGCVHTSTSQKGSCEWCELYY